MRDGPDAADLLAVARETLMRDLLPTLPGERRYDALMVAAAMGIAARELTSGDAPLRRAEATLRDLMGDGEPVALSWRLSREIRAGGWDGPAGKAMALREALWRLTLDKLRDANPKYLETRDLT